MTQKATFYHAGCSVFRDAERLIAAALDPGRCRVEIVHLGTDRSRLAEAESAGVAPVPALVVGRAPLRINSGAALAGLKGGA